MGNSKKEIQAKLDAHHSGQSNEPISGPAHTLSFDDVVAQLNSSAIDGLTPDEAKKRLEQYGKNELDNGPGVNPVRILIRQIANAMMLVSRTSSSDPFHPPVQGDLTQQWKNLELTTR
jgi:P-type Na+/K+ transporter